MHDFTFTMPAGIRYGIGMHEQLGTMLKDEMQFQKVFILTGRHVARSGIIESKVYPLSRTFLSNRQTVTVTFPADNFLFPIGCMK